MMTAPRFAHCATLQAIGLLLIAQSALGQSPSASPRPSVELHLWGSYTAFSGDATASGTKSASGLRSLDVAFWPSQALRLFAGYENSLSLENLTLIRSNRAVPLYRAGAMANWGGHFTTIVDGGHRSLPGDVSQNLVGLEQVAYLASGTALKAGAQVGVRSDHRTEWVGHVGVNAAAGERLRFEPTVFVARSGLPGESQWRALLSSEYRPGREVSLTAGLAAGRNKSFDGAYTGTVLDAHLKATASIGGMNRAHVLIRHERVAGAQPFTTVAMGLSLVATRVR
ncbi:MAG: hypothetical protein U0132_17140 [Gemmatimonadaceae bacterium]